MSKFQVYLKRIWAIGLTVIAILTATACTDGVNTSDDNDGASQAESSVEENGSNADISRDDSKDESKDESDKENSDASTNDNSTDTNDISSESNNEISSGEPENDYRKAYAEHVVKEIEEYSCHILGAIIDSDYSGARKWLDSNGFVFIGYGFNDHVYFDQEHGCGMTNAYDENNNLIDAYRIESMWDAGGWEQRAYMSLPVGHETAYTVCDTFDIPFNEKYKAYFTVGEILDMTEEELDALVELCKSTMYYHRAYHGWDDFNPDNAVNN